MDKIRKVMIVGLGALGTLYADAFQKTEGTEVFVLVDEERKARYEKEPRILKGEKCVFDYVTPDMADSISEMDLILVCTKSNGMDQAIDMVEGYVGEDTIIASLMNGVSFEEKAAAKYGMDHVVYMIYMGDGVKNLNGEVYDTNINRLFYGSLGNERDEEQVSLIKEFYDRAGILHEVSDNMLYTYWRKFMLIVSFNQACAVYGQDYSVFHNVPRARELTDGLLRECIPVAKAAGVENAEDLFDDINGAAMSIAHDCMPSIMQDRLMQRRMEVDIFSDEIVRRGRKLGIETPFNEMVSLILNVINEQNGM